MTEQEIILHLADYIDNRKYPFQLPNSFVYKWESDYWTMDADGITREYEIKITRSDFKKDALKDKHKVMHEAGANYFYYVCPKDLIKASEVDKRYGLLYVWDGGHVEVIKRPLKLHPNPYTRWRELCVKLWWKWHGLWKEKMLRKEITFKEYKKTNYEICTSY